MNKKTIAALVTAKAIILSSATLHLTEWQLQDNDRPDWVGPRYDTLDICADELHEDRREAAAGLSGDPDRWQKAYDATHRVTCSVTLHHNYSALFRAD